MEPATILALTNASLGIARSLVHTVKELYELAEAYETAALGIRTVATQCNSFRVAIQRIHTWLKSQDESSRHNLDEDFWQALNDNLETGKLVLDDLERRISGLKKDSAKFWTRTKYLWNSVVISELQSQIQGLMAAVSILVQVIDIPTTGGKRSQSLAQRSRLNNITKSVRLTVDQRRERIQRSEEQNLLDDVDNDSTSGALEDPLPPSLPSAARQQTGDSLNTDNAPPAYEYYDKDLKETKRKSTPILYDTKTAPENSSRERESSFRVLDKSESRDSKPKRSIWTMGFKKRPSTPKVEQAVRSSSSSRDDSQKDAAGSSTTTSQILNPFDDSNVQMQQTPAVVEPAKEEKEYFGLQEAMAGVSMSTPPVEMDTEPVQISRTLSPPHTQRSLTDPTRSDNSQTTSQPNSPETTTTTPSYYPPPQTNTTNTKNSPISPPTNPYASLSSKPAFDRIRPSQRVREARERSRSRDPPRDHRQTTSPEPLNRQISPPTLPTSTSTQGSTTQTWRTTPLLSSNTTSSLATQSHTRLKVTFSPTLYTSRISYSAARALHLLDHANTNTIDGVPIATLTLLYLVSDGASQAVSADEVELEVMHESEGRGLEIILGAGLVHVQGVMEGSEGGCLWWSERGVPRGLRTVEGLRLFRRFELCRW